MRTMLGLGPRIVKGGEQVRVAAGGSLSLVERFVADRVRLLSALALSTFPRMRRFFFGFCVAAARKGFAGASRLAASERALHFFLECLSFMRLALAMKARFEMSWASPCDTERSTRLLLAIDLISLAHNEPILLAADGDVVAPLRRVLLGRRCFTPFGRGGRLW